MDLRPDSGAQRILPHGAASDELLPVRNFNEYTYCPRLFNLMHVDGRTLWEEANA